MAIEAGGRRNFKSPPLGSQAFLQMLQMREDLAFGQTGRLGQLPQAHRLWAKRLTESFTGGLDPVWRRNPVHPGKGRAISGRP